MYLRNDKFLPNFDQLMIMKILKLYLISSLFFIFGCNSKPSVISLDNPMFVTESVADAAQRVTSMRQRIDGVDDLLARLKLSHD